MQSFPNRCQHLKINGTQCGSPALRRNRFCFFHKRFPDERIKLSADRARRGVATFVLPVLEDANSIQIALMQVMCLLVSQRIDHKTASLLLYALQTASTNLRMTNFKPFIHEVILDPRDAANTPLDSYIWDDEDFEEEEEEETDADRAIAALEATRKKKERRRRRRRRSQMDEMGRSSISGSKQARQSDNRSHRHGKRRSRPRNSPKKARSQPRPQRNPRRDRSENNYFPPLAAKFPGKEPDKHQEKKAT